MSELSGRDRFIQLLWQTASQVGRCQNSRCEACSSEAGGPRAALVVENEISRLSVPIRHGGLAAWWSGIGDSTSIGSVRCRGCGRPSWKARPSAGSASTRWRLSISGTFGRCDPVTRQLSSSCRSRSESCPSAAPRRPSSTQELYEIPSEAQIGGRPVGRFNALSHALQGAPDARAIASVRVEASRLSAPKPIRADGARRPSRRRRDRLFGAEHRPLHLGSSSARPTVPHVTG